MQIYFSRRQLGAYRVSWDRDVGNPTMMHALAVPRHGGGLLRWGGGEQEFEAGATLFVR